jgi:hypothetical protein
MSKLALPPDAFVFVGDGADRVYRAATLLGSEPETTRAPEGARSEPVARAANALT